MNKLPVLLATLCLAACGTMGFGKNHVVNIQNNSDYVVTASGEHGTTKIQPNSSASIHGTKPINLTSKNCASQVIDTDVNMTAFLLDIIPGMFVFWIPYGIDAITGGITNLPENYTYDC